MRDEFSTLDIVKALKIPRERLRDWMNQGFVKPTTPADGQGTKAIFTRNDIYCIALFQRLLEIGFKREDASRKVKYFSEDLECVAQSNVIIFPIVQKDGKLTLSEYHQSDITEGYVEDVPPYDQKTGEEWLRSEGLYDEYRDSGKLDEFLIESKKRYDSIRKNLPKRLAMRAVESLPKFFKHGFYNKYGEEWEHVHIVNYKKIRMKVDRALLSFD